jgi:arabinose-5-phosphate isomerase
MTSMPITARSRSIDAGLQPLEAARSIIRHESHALWQLATGLDEQFSRAVELLVGCRGSVMVSGMGKAGLVGQKIAATLASTGTRSHFIHPAEAIHGDLGRLHRDDVMLLLSHSGETEEVLRLLPSIDALGVPIMAITGRPRSRLGRAAEIVLSIGEVREAGPLELAPTTSTTAMLALGDALALVSSQRRGFGPDDFARCHPGGALGRSLTQVDDVMRPLDQCRVALQSHTVRHVLISLSRPGRRSGAVLLTDSAGSLTGIFTDSDLARLLERQHDALLDKPIELVMTNSPSCVPRGTMMSLAVQLLTERKISELPVIDEGRRPVGLVDITDIVAFLPLDESASPRASHDSSDGPRILSLTNPSTFARIDET